MMGALCKVRSRVTNWTRFLVASFFVCLALSIHAQNEIENVFVETYYISDANDGTDDIGGPLATGSKTFRVYIDLCADCSLRSIFGSPEHPLVLESTAPFFNNIDRGRTFGHEINNSALDENTVALDSWLSFGAASNQKFGVPKVDDPDGSIIGGSNNDGGSTNISGGLLVNSDAEAGVPLTEQDGLTLLDGTPALPPNFQVTGTSPDTVFASETTSGMFSSTNTRMLCSVPGVRGPDASNRILIAQLTTTGDLQFRINVDIQRGDGSVLRFVSGVSVLLEGETPNGLLSYPPQCGCTDPAFVEYDPSAGCDDGSCQTAIVFGCLDTLACNYTSAANFNISELCCYGPNDCNGLDVSIVCPEVGIEALENGMGINLFPNPASDLIHIIASGNTRIGSVTVFDAMGRTVLYDTERSNTDGRTELDLGDLATGVYRSVIVTSEGRVVRSFIKVDQ